MFFQVASATATRYGLSRGLLGLKYDQINYSDSDSDSVAELVVRSAGIRKFWVRIPFAIFIKKKFTSNLYLNSYFLTFLLVYKH